MVTDIADYLLRKKIISKHQRGFITRKLLENPSLENSLQLISSLGPVMFLIFLTMFYIVANE